ncbi:MAG: hypothetical protein LBT02_01250 [Rickettsiales bacterium]|nr:hypothetical protein [Rickettsiales bacterium]
MNYNNIIYDNNKRKKTRLLAYISILSLSLSLSLLVGRMQRVLRMTTY